VLDVSQQEKLTYNGFPPLELRDHIRVANKGQLRFWGTQILNIPQHQGVIPLAFQRGHINCE